MKTILTDADDTILECGDALQQFLEEEFGLVSTKRLRDHHNIPQLYGIDIDRTLEMVACFHRSSWMTRLHPLPCAAVVLPELYRQGYKFIAITACLNESETIAARKTNLEEAFGFEWEAVHCIGLTPSKKDALESYSPSIWVDDLAHHASDGSDAGHYSFLIDKPYNQSLENSSVTRVKDWHQLAECLNQGL